MAKQLTHSNLGSRPLFTARLRTNTFCIWLSNGIVFTQCSLGKTKRPRSLPTAPAVEELTQQAHTIARRSGPYITRPAVSTKRLSLTRNAQIRYELKKSRRFRRTRWQNGTTHVIFEPLDFISRLVSLVPRASVNLARFQGVCAPNSKYRARVTAARRGK